MASSLQRKIDPPARRVSADQPVVVPTDAPATDDAPTVISKTPPLLDPVSSANNKITDLAAHGSSQESLIASLRGKRLAHFELIDKIGVGGMAAVVRARDTQLDRFVALKILPPEMASEPENVSRFHQEARAAARLDHENIARVFYCGEDQGLYFIAFEFVEGINLRNLLEQRGRLPVAETVRYILQVATGLEHAATRGVVHRDVKPSNIIITPTGRAKLVDMGLARNLERHGERDLTQSGVTLGTFDYISPEQALEPREADSRSDIYSLGCTMYHLLTGMPPVPEGTPAKKLQHHQQVAPVDPRQFDPKIPDEIVMILGKMMAKNPKDRYQRPIHLVHHLMQVARNVGAADDLPEGMLLVDAPLPGQMQPRPILAIGLALLALVIMTMLLSLFGDPGPTHHFRGVPQGSDNKITPVVVDPGSAGQKKDSASTSGPLTIAEKHAHLKELLEDASTKHVKARIQGNIDLEDGIAFKGGKDRRLELESDDPDYVTSFQYNNSPSGLLLEGGEEIIIRGVKFRLDSKNQAAKIVAAAVTLRGVRSVKFEQCVFAQPSVPRISLKPGVLASVFIDTPAGAEPPVIQFNKCFFDTSAQLGGQVAVAINGPATVHVTNCAFKSHGAMFQFRKDCTKDATIVHLQHCSSYLMHGPASVSSRGPPPRYTQRAISSRAPRARSRWTVCFLSRD
jgi:serine/threonine protein kinase